MEVEVVVVVEVGVPPEAQAEHQEEVQEHLRRAALAQLVVQPALAVHRSLTRHAVRALAAPLDAPPVPPERLLPALLVSPLPARAALRRPVALRSDERFELANRRVIHVRVGPDLLQKKEQQCLHRALAEPR